MKLSFQSRVLLSFVGLIFFAQVGTTVAVLIAAQRNAYEISARQLEVATQVLQKSLQSRAHQLRSTVSAVATDFGFREAVTSHDDRTIVSALVNQGTRINASLALLTDRGAHLLSTTDVAASADPLFATADFVDRLRKEPNGIGSGLFNGRLLQFVAVPIKAPDVVGYLCMGFPIDDDLAQQIKETSGVDVSLIASSTSEGPSLLASTLSAKARADLAKSGATPTDNAADPSFMTLDGEHFQTLVIREAADAGGVYTVLQLSTRKINAQLAHLRNELIVWAGLILVVGLIAAIIGARFLSEPVQALATAAQSLRLSKRREGRDKDGDDDELANLAATFHALAQRAHYDALTGLPNRTLVTHRIATAITKANEIDEPLAVVFIDLNGFKKINDTLGHEMGDLVLRKTAKRLMQAMKPTDTVARLGGDEFVLVLEGASQTGALRVVDNLIALVSQPMQSDSGPIQVGMSAGIAIFPDHAQNQESLLRLADAAMYESKTRKFGPVIARPPTVTEAVAAGPPSTDTTTIDPTLTTWGSGKWKDRDLQTQRQPAFKNREIDASQRTAKAKALGKP